MEGRVLIDIMKVVQRDHKLDSYKLDNVKSHFMKMNKMMFILLIF
jgi:DNA polymerase elongation subunit (family B)